LKGLRAMSSVGWQALSRLGISLLLGLILGLMFGQVAWALTITLALHAVFQVWNLLRLDHWLRYRRIAQPPDISGPWGEVLTIVHRIYRRKQFHKAHVTSLLREFRRLTSAMPEGALLLGPEHEILWFNQRAAEWLHLRRKRDFGIRIENLVRHPNFVNYIRTSAPSEGVVVYQPSEHGGRWLSFNLVNSGASQRQLLILRDVSRQVHLEAMRKDFVANASHELRSPLTVISGYLDALADDEKLDATWNSPVLEMRRQAERMNAIINDLLELSKLESGSRQQEQQPVDIAALFALLRREITVMERAPKVVVKIDSDARLNGIETEIHSIVSNLASNAAKYTPQDGKVELRWWTDAMGAHIAVQDTGIGIPAEHIPRLTERFYRVDAGRARDVGGSGLGLAIVKHALQRHDGSLQIQSQEGRGSTFTCHFPPQRIAPSSLSAGSDDRRSAGV
jgi:two-component system, OmpR family, phosphate regulon sensor histidine kinase PhoR